MRKPAEDAKADVSPPPPPEDGTNVAGPIMLLGAGSPVVNEEGTVEVAENEANNGTEEEERNDVGKAEMEPVVVVKGEGRLEEEAEHNKGWEAMGEGRTDVEVL